MTGTTLSCPLGAGLAREGGTAAPGMAPAAMPASMPSSHLSSEYADYMRTDELLSLQRPGNGLLHRDERLFQCVHQSTELWLKQAVFELEHATELTQAGRVSAAAHLLARVSACIDYVTRPLGVLTTISSLDFGTFRPALGKGSGLESPGWGALRKAAPKLQAAFIAQCEAQRLSPHEVFRRGADCTLCVMAEAMLDVDTQVANWRMHHLAVTVRTIGDGGVGTKGMPVQSLAQMLGQRLFADLWQARSDLAAASY